MSRTGARYGRVVAITAFAALLFSVAAHRSALALTFAELQEKINKDGSERVAGELLQSKSEGALNQVVATLVQSRRQLRDSPDQLWFQLSARNVGNENAELAKFLGPPKLPMLVAKSATLQQTSAALLGLAFDSEPGVRAFRLSDDGTRIFCSLTDLSLRVLDAESLKEVARYTPTDHAARQAHRPENPLVGVDSKGNFVFARSPTEFSQLNASGWQWALDGVFRPAADIYTSRTISPDGALIIDQSGRGRYAVTSTKRDTAPVEFSVEGDVFAGNACFLRLLADGKRLVIGDDHGNLTLFDLPTGKRLKPTQQFGSASAYTMSADRTRVAVAPYNSVTSNSGLLATIWDLEEWKEIAKFEEPEFAWAASIDFLGDRNTLLTLDAQSSLLKIWRVGNKQPVRSLMPPARLIFMDANPAGDRLYGVAVNYSLMSFDIKKLADAPPASPHAERISAVAISNDGKLAASLDYNGGLTLWDMQSGGQVDRLELQRPPRVQTFLSDSRSSALVFASSTDEILVSSTSSEKPPTIIHWIGQPRTRRDVPPDDKRLTADRTRGNPIQGPFLLPQGIAAACLHGQDANRSLIAFSPATGKIFRDIPAKPDWGVELMALSRQLAIFWGREVKGAYVTAVEFKSGQTWRATLFGNIIYKAEVSSNSDVVFASGSVDRHPSVDAPSLAFAHLKTGDVKQVKSAGITTALAVSPDGALAFSGDLKGNLKVWDVNRAANIGTFTLDLKITAIQFDGRNVVVGDENGRVHLFEWKTAP